MRGENLVISPQNRLSEWRQAATNSSKLRTAHVGGGCPQWHPVWPPHERAQPNASSRRCGHRVRCIVAIRGESASLVIARPMTRALVERCRGFLWHPVVHQAAPSAGASGGTAASGANPVTPAVRAAQPRWLQGEGGCLGKTIAWRGGGEGSGADRTARAWWRACGGIRGGDSSDAVAACRLGQPRKGRFCRAPARRGGGRPHA